MSQRISAGAAGTWPPDLMLEPHSDRHLLTQVVEDELVILALDRGEYYKLNEVGARVWHLLHQLKPLGQVIAMLQEEYDVTTEQLAQDVMALLADLESQGLVEFQNTPGD